MRAHAAPRVLAGCATLVLWLAAAGEAVAAGWKVRPTPNPIGATHSQLVGVSCPSRNLCLAVGYSSVRGGAFTTLMERWDGSSWSIQATPRAPGTQVSVLSAISCASRSACTAVGYFTNRAGVAVPLAEHWNGTGWSLQQPLHPPSATYSYLVAVSCAARRSCTAVGSFGDANGNEVGLAERWDGTRWSIQPLQTPPGATASRLKAASCTSPTACTAVGTFVDLYGDYLTLVERWNGTNWAVQPSANPSANDSELAGAWCAPSGSCEAVGFFAKGSGPLLTLAERWNGTSWVIQPTPNHSRARTSQLFAVACRSTNACSAVGNFANGGGAFGTLAERGKHGRWDIQRTARPAGATNSGLDAVACPTASSCTAVGYLIDRSGHVLTLAEQSA